MINHFPPDSLERLLAFHADLLKGVEHGVAQVADQAVAVLVHKAHERVDVRDAVAEKKISNLHLISFPKNNKIGKDYF